MSVSGVFRAGMLCCIGGTAFGLFFSWSLGVVLLLVSVLIAILIAWVHRYRAQVTIASSICLIVFCGAWAHASNVTEGWNVLPESESTLLRAVVVRQVEQKENSKQAVLRSIECGDVSCPEVLVLGVFPLFADISEGNIVSLSCPLEKPKQFTSEFDYPKMLAKDGIGYVCRFPKEWLVIGVSETVFHSSLRTVREALELGINRALPEPESGLVAGLLLGGDDRLPGTLQDQFSRTGLSHVVAVSGYNVSIVAILFMSVFTAIGLYRQQAFWVALFGIGCFTVLVGFPASAVRAAIMASVALLATRVERAGSSRDAILFSATVMLLFNPLLLRYDIGFQLSFLATIGIVSLAPFALTSLRLGDILATTLAAEIFILPILLFHFHALPVFSLLANSIVLPLVPIAMFLGAIAAVSGMLVPWAATVFGFPAFLVSWSILALVRWISEYDLTSVEVSHFGLFSVILWYGVLSCTIFFLRRKRTLEFSLKRAI